MADISEPIEAISPGDYDAARAVMKEIRQAIIEELRTQDAESLRVRRSIYTTDIVLQTLPEGRLWWYLHPIQSWRACWNFHKAIADGNHLFERSKLFFAWLEKLEGYLSSTQPFRYSPDVPAFLRAAAAANDVQRDDAIILPAEDPSKPTLNECPNARPRYLDFLMNVIDDFDAEAIANMKKDELKLEIRNRWDSDNLGGPLSAHLLDVMATLLRPPEAQRGGAKRQRRSDK